MTPLNFEQVKAVIDRASYRPGWTFTLHGALPVPSAPFMTVDGPIIDAEDFTKETRVGWRVAVPMDFQSEKEVMEWLAYCVQRVEIHESREFLKLDGQTWDSPHA